MPKNKDRTAWELPKVTQPEDAIFRGWQKTGVGLDIALYNITAAGHPSVGSTVTGETLHKLNLQVPDARPPQGSMKRFRSSGKQNR